VQCLEFAQFFLVLIIYIVLCYLFIFMLYSFFFYSSFNDPNLHSFPTRRSSDLALKYYRTATFSFLIGLVIGSIYKIFPGWSDSFGQLFISVIVFAAGLVVAYGLGKIEHQRRNVVQIHIVYKG